MQLARNPLPPQPRPRSLVRLETEIATQERARERCAERAAGLDATGRDSRQARAMLSIVEEHLAQLHRSREALLRGEDGEEGAGPEPRGRPPLVAIPPAW
jgi:hypothetical protein